MSFTTIFSVYVRAYAISLQLSIDLLITKIVHEVHSRPSSGDCQLYMVTFSSTNWSMLTEPWELTV